MDVEMDRQCDGCTLCCTLTRVPELNKPEGVTCQFACKGCTIYQSRPQSCRDFACAWLQGDMPEWMKPDKTHVMVEKIPNSSVVMALPEPGYELTWETPEIISELKKQYVEKGIAVVTKGMKAMIPEGMTPAQVNITVTRYAKAQGVV